MSKGTPAEADPHTGLGMTHLPHLQHMDNISQGKRAIRELDGYELHGSALSVQESRSQPFQHSPSPLPPAEPQFNRAPASHPQSYYREPPPPDPCLPAPALYEPQYSRPASYYRGRYDPYLPLPAPHHARGWGEEHRVGTLAYS